MPKIDKKVRTFSSIDKLMKDNVPGSVKIFCNDWFSSDEDDDDEERDRNWFQPFYKIGELWYGPTNDKNYDYYHESRGRWKIYKVPIPTMCKHFEMMHEISNLGNNTSTWFVNGTLCMEDKAVEKEMLGWKRTGRVFDLEMK